MRCSVLVLGSLMAVGTMFAQPDPPSRVARLNYISGSVQFQPAGVDEWTAAPFNRPLITGDQLWIDQSARAEMHIGSTALRFADRTALSLTNLDDQTTQIRLSQGLIEVRLRTLTDNEVFEIDTPNAALSLLRPGIYRIEADPDRQTTLVTVRSGQGEVTSGGQAFTVRPRDQARIVGEASVTYDLTSAPPLDSWDEWCASRDRREEQSASVRYVSREMIGYEDLDDHGAWRPAASYGAVWFPRDVPVGWAPYRYGHWVWVEPWGWTWVDDAPWGFAPFHYGRWVYVSGAWGWVPGPVVARPVYSPALVAWVGGSHFSLSVSIGGGGGGHVGWFPLGPGEVFVPAYHASPHYVTNVNTTNTVVNNVTITKVYNNTNVTNVNNITYVNRNAPGAMTVVPHDALTKSRPVYQAAVSVPANQIASAPVVTTAPVAPTRQSVVGTSTPAAASAGPRPPAAAFHRAVVSRTAAPPPPVPFAAKQQALQADPGRPVAPEQIQVLRQKMNPEVRPMVRQQQMPQPPPAPQAPRAPQGFERQPAMNQPAVNAPRQPIEREAIRPAATQPPPGVGHEAVRPRGAEMKPKDERKKEEKREERREEKREDKR